MTDIERVIEEAKKEVVPFESWERLPGESAAAYAAFCAYRDYGPERNIKRSVDKHTGDQELARKQYRIWRGFAARFQWADRAAEYDQYLDRLKLAERRKTIVEREAAHREVTEKMLRAVNKKLDLMEAGELSQGNVVDWVRTAVQTERVILGLGAAEEEKRERAGKQLEIAFFPEFSGI